MRSIVNRYQVFAANPDGTEGQLMAFAEQKRMKLKEEITFLTDESRSRPVFVLFQDPVGESGRAGVSVTVRPSLLIVQQVFGLLQPGYALDDQQRRCRECRPAAAHRIRQQGLSRPASGWT